jgi:hypothetical protein
MTRFYILKALKMKNGTPSTTCCTDSFIIVLNFETTQEFVRYSSGNRRNGHRKHHEFCAYSLLRNVINTGSWNFFSGNLFDVSRTGEHLAEGYAAAISTIYDFENKPKRPCARENFTACLKNFKLTGILCSDVFFPFLAVSFTCLLTLVSCVFPFLSTYHSLFSFYETTTARVIKRTCLLCLI